MKILSWTWCKYVTMKRNRKCFYILNSEFEESTDEPEIVEGPFPFPARSFCMELFYTSTLEFKWDNIIKILNDPWNDCDPWFEWRCKFEFDPQFESFINSESVVREPDQNFRDLSNTGGDHICMRLFEVSTIQTNFALSQARKHGSFDGFSYILSLFLA